MGKEFNSPKVVILAAGLGTRLRPLTDTLPKVMLPIVPGKPILEHLVTHMRDQGLRDFIVNLHHCPEKITEHFGDGGRFGVHIAYSDETKEVLDTGGAIKKIEESVGDTFVLLYGDMLHALDFKPIVRFHERAGGVATVVTGTSGVPQEGDVAEIDPVSKRIMKWHSRPHEIRRLGGTFFWNTGLYVLSKEILSHISPGKPVNLDRDVLPILIREGHAVYSYPVSDPVYDTGTHEKYAFAKEWYKNNIQP